VSFSDQPRTTQAGQTLPPVRFTAFDASGNQLRDFTGDVTITIAYNPAGGTLSGSKTVSMHPSLGGVGEFLDLSIDNPGNGYVLQITSPGVGGDQSDPFDITSGPPPSLNGATGLGFLQQPTNPRAGQVISPAIRIAALDDNGNIVPAFTGAVWVSLISNSTGATLSGTRRVVVVNGVATFSDLSIDKPGSGYELRATHWPLNEKNSVPFNVSP
jgi:hypothetical protein